MFSVCEGSLGRFKSIRLLIKRYIFTKKRFKRLSFDGWSDREEVKNDIVASGVENLLCRLAESQKNLWRVSQQNLPEGLA